MIKICNKIIEIDIAFHSAYYNKACAYSIKKDSEKAIKFLRKSILLEPHSKELAKKDEDFDSIKELNEFKELTK